MRVNILKILLIFFMLKTPLFSSDRVNIKIIETYENIRYIGQKIAKEYLFLYKNPKKVEIRELLYSDIKLLERYIQNIEEVTGGKELTKFLSFLKYNKDRLKEFLKRDLNREKCIKILDYSDGFLDWSNRIERIYRYEFSINENHLIALKDIEYLLQRAVKHYLAYTVDIDRAENLKNMKFAIESIDKKLDYINSLHYSDYILNILLKLNRDWGVYKGYLYEVDKLDISNLIFLSTSEFEQDIREIANYFKQNQ